MNRLTNKAPQVVSVNGVDYKVNTGVRNCLLSIMAIEADELTQFEKAEIIIENLYSIKTSEIPNEDITEALNMALWFLSGGRENKGDNRPKNCDFKKDGDLIYNAFLKAGIDLDKEDMHWWKFLALFSELPESQFTRVIQLRYKKRKGKLSKEDKEECGLIGWDVIDLSSDDDLEEMLKFLREED